MVVKTAKELKTEWRPKFAQDPAQYYPSKVFEKYGFKSGVCPKCKTLYWFKNDKHTTCGDSECIGEYLFIKPENEQNKNASSENNPLFTQKGVFESFVNHFTQTQPVKHTLVKRYPVVARWRDDCEFTAAGIQCYQPFCVTGEVQPPANPLIQSQFCVRFNDLDSIGLSGRHYSGFHMLGIQVFNSEGNHRYWKEEAIEYNIQWIEKLGLSLEDVTFTADCWAGGGNLGPSIEYFVGGLEIGNIVFMEYKCFPDGSIEKLPVQVVDVGIGLERIPWLISGGVTSYITTFPTALKRFCELTNFDVKELTNDAWTKFSRYSCLLNIDEVSDLQETWKSISEKCGYNDVNAFKNDITKVREVYIILDHIRSLLVTINDGALPGNVGGGNNLRNVIRKLFNLIEEHKEWHNLFQIENIKALLEANVQDLDEIHGAGSFKLHSSILEVFELEMKRWRTTDKQAEQKIKAMLKKKPVFSVDDWVLCVTTHGMDAAQVSKIINAPVPENLNAKIAEQQERNAVKVAPTQLYNLNAHQPTDQLYYSRENYEFVFNYDEENEIIDILVDKENKSGLKSILILKDTIFYPTSGGQANDTGKIRINGKEYNIVNCTKVGPCVLHYADTEITEQVGYKGRIELCVDKARRIQLMQHHTGAHVLSAACREVLGPHVWQAGARKTPEYATLDITHYESLSHAHQRQIEQVAQRLIQRSIPITKCFHEKNVAEEMYGFTLYQGGVVPGSVVRCVSVLDVDNEACCGTHLDNTGKIGLFKLQKATRISDGVVRLQFVCGEAALKYEDELEGVLEQLREMWSISTPAIPQTAEKFFSGFKHLESQVNTLQKQLLFERLQKRDQDKISIFQASESAPTRYLSDLGEVLAGLAGSPGSQKAKTAVPVQAPIVFAGASFLVYAGPSGQVDTLVGKLTDGFTYKRQPMKVPNGYETDAQMLLFTKLDKGPNDLLKIIQE